MSETQYAVFHFDVKTLSMRDAQGNYLSPGNDSPLILDSLAAAQHYCREKTAATPALGCRIYDRNGRVVQSFSNDALYDRYHGLPAARRSFAIGAASLLAGAGGVALDAWLGWRLTFGVLLGIRFLWFGTVKVLDGVAVWHAERPAR
jgi:hypothetical protein